MFNLFEIALNTHYHKSVLQSQDVKAKNASPHLKIRIILNLKKKLGFRADSVLSQQIV